MLKKVITDLKGLTVAFPGILRLVYCPFLSVLCCDANGRVSEEGQSFAFSHLTKVAFVLGLGLG